MTTPGGNRIMAWRLPPCACQADQENFAEAQLNNPLATDAMDALAAPSAAEPTPSGATY
jgi:hypothetical protein